MYVLIYSNKFKKDIKLCKKRNYDFDEFKTVIKTLETIGKLTPKYKPHILSGDYSKHWECHIKPDWLLIWTQNDNRKEINLVRTGTHSDLFCPLERQEFFITKKNVIFATNADQLFKRELKKWWYKDYNL